MRMIERGGFGDPTSGRTAILIECGQHWERSSAVVAIDTLARFLQVSGAMSAAQLPAERPSVQTSAQQQVVRVTEAVVAKSGDFRFVRRFHGLEVIERAGDLIAVDGDERWHAPYDNTVLVMPSMAHCKPGTTMVRLGRYETLP
jgi:hypothetical protein